VAYPVDANFDGAVWVCGVGVVDESLSPFPILLVVDFEVDDGCVCVAVACLLPGEVASGGEERNILEAELLCARAARCVRDGVFSDAQ